MTLKARDSARNIICLWMALCLLPALIIAQSRDIPHFQNYPDDQGFPGSLIYDISDDALGFMWFCTDNGLFRFDGYSYRAYTHKEDDAQSLPLGLVTSVYRDSHQTLWLGCGRFICRYESETDNFRCFALSEDSQETFRITGLFEDNQGKIFVCAEPYNVFVFDPQKQTTEEVSLPLLPDGSTPIRVKDGFTDKQGFIWLASIQGVIGYDPVKKTTLQYNDYPASNHGSKKLGIVTSVIADPMDDNFLYCGTWGNGLVHLDKRSGKIDAFLYQPAQPSNLNNILFDLKQKNEDQLWVASRVPGVFDLREKTFHFYTSESSRPREVLQSEVRCIHTDQRGQHWFGTVNGVSVIDPQHEEVKYRTLGKPHLGISRIAFDPKREEYLILNIYNSRTLRITDKNWNILHAFPIPEADALQSEPFTPFLFSEDELWIGTTRQGILTFDLRTHRFAKLASTWPQGVEAEKTYPGCFARDAQGRIWMGSLKYGLLSYDPKTRTWNDESERVRPLYRRLVSIEKIHVDEEGTIWCMAPFVGIIGFNPTSGTRATYLQNDILDFELLPEKRLAVCGNLRGANLLSYSSGEVKSIKTFNRENGSPANGFNDLCMDGQGNLWLLYSRGLVHLNAEFDLINHYSDFAGLTGNFSDASVFCFNQDEILLPYIEGIYFIPQFQNRLSYTFRPVMLTSLMVQGLKKALPFGNKIHEGEKFPYNENFFNFEFASIEFTRQSGLRYAYYLEGNDAAWIFSGDRRNVSYSDLSFGKYALHVKVQSPDGAWGPDQIIYQFEILPAWWQTWWFRIALLILGISATASVVRYYSTRRLRKQVQQMQIQRNIEQIRNRIARDIHDEIGSGLTKISLMSAQLPESGYSAKIQKTSREIIENMGEIIWAVNPENDVLENLVAHVRELSGRFFEDSNIRLHSDIAAVPAELSGRTISPEIKRNLMLILKEAMNNVVKHSGADSCTVRLSFSDKNIFLSIADNGSGLPAEINTSRNGMKNMEKRSRECKGRMSVNSSDQGLTLDFIFPV